MRPGVTWLKTPAAFLMLKKTGELWLCGGAVGGGVSEQDDDRRRQ